MKIGITGISGYIGTEIYKTLRANRKTDIVGFDLDSTEYLDDCIFVKTDILSSDLKTLFKDFDVIVHAAARTGPGYNENPFYDFQINTVGTLRVLDAVRQISPNCKIILFSSAMVYDSMGEVNPPTVFGAGKLSSEIYGRAFSKTYRMDICALRLFNVIGSNCIAPHGRGVTQNFIEKLEREESIKVMKNTFRDFVHVRDVALLVQKLCFHPTRINTFDSMDVGTGVASSIIELANIICDVFEVDYKTYVCEVENSHESRTCANTNQLFRIANPQEFASLRDSIVQIREFIGTTKKRKPTRN